MDTAQWPQDIVVKPMEENTITTNTTYPKPSSVEKSKVRPQKDQAVNCPRCNSTNTKFCYYNNYSLSQPRYFCKTCRRYWTHGGSLRNIPVGGGSRKNKRSSSSTTSTSSPSSILAPNNNNKKSFPNLVPPLLIPPQNPKNHHQDLNLGIFTPHHDFKAINELIQVPNYEAKDNMQNNNNPSSNSSSASPHHQNPPPPHLHLHLSAMELLTGISTTTATNSASRGLNSFLPMPDNIANSSAVYSSTSGFTLPSLNFSLDGIGSSNYGSFQETDGKLLFPFHNQVISSSGTNGAEQSRDNQNGDSNGNYWNGVMGTGGSW